MIALYAVALLWVLAYVAGGWPGVLLVASAGAAFDALLLGLRSLQGDEDRAVAARRLRLWEAERSTRKDRAA